MIPDMNSCAATDITRAWKPSLPIETTAVIGPGKGPARAASDDRMTGASAVDCRQREALPPTRHRGATTIFQRPARTAKVLRDIPARSKGTYKGIQPGTMALLSLLPSEHGERDMLHVAWRTMVHDQPSDVMTLDEAGVFFDLA